MPGKPADFEAGFPYRASPLQPRILGCRRAVADCGWREQSAFPLSLTAELWSDFQVISPGVQRGLPRVLAFGVVDRDRGWIDGNIMLAVAHNLTDRQDRSRAEHRELPRPRQIAFTARWQSFSGPGESRTVFQRHLLVSCQREAYEHLNVPRGIAGSPIGGASGDQLQRHLRERGLEQRLTASGSDRGELRETCASSIILESNFATKMKCIGFSRSGLSRSSGGMSSMSPHDV